MPSVNPGPAQTDTTNLVPSLGTSAGANPTVYIPASLNTQDIINSALAANAGGGGIVSLPAQTITVNQSLPLLSGVIYQGAGYGLTGTGTPTLASGTIIQGNGTFPIFAGNSIDLAAPYATTNALFANGINDVQIRNLGISNGSYGIKLGALYQMGGLYPRIYDVFIQNCTQWAMWLENCTQSTIELVASYFNNHGIMEMASGTSLNNFGNSHYRKIVVGHSTANGSGRSFQVGSRGTAYGGSVMNNVMMYDLGMSGNVISSTQAATMSNGSTLIGVTDLSKFGVGMPVNFTSTANGFTINLIYFVASVSGTTGAGNITVCAAMCGASGGTAISATGNTAINIFTSGWPQLEVGGTDANSTVTYSSVRGAADIEVGGTAHIVFQGITGFFYDGGINHSTPSTADICVRQCAAQGFILNLQAALNLDLDSNAQYIQVNGRQQTALNSNYAGIGITQANSNGTGQLNLRGSSTPDLQAQSNFNNQLVWTYAVALASAQLATTATITSANGNNITFVTAAGGSLTLPAVTTNMAGWELRISNPQANAVTVNATSVNIVGLGTSVTSFSLAATTNAFLVLHNNAGTMYWARYV